VNLVACPAPTYRVDVAAVRRFINSNTVIIVGSAPNYPHGVIDDITALSKLGYKYKIPLHVDCCLGSFLVPLLDKAGFPSEPMDFKLKGVTSISCDTHKYGFAPKGSSTVLYRNESLRQYQYFITPEWPGGVYGSPGIAGSRPGALIAGCWASMMAMGESGYIDACHKIVGCARNIETAIREDEALSVDLRVMGKPMVSVVSFSSPTIDIYAVSDGMSTKGWHLNSLQNPAAIHVAVTLPIVAVWEDLIKDLKEVVANINEQTKKDVAAGVDVKNKKRGNASALYGVAAVLPSKVVVEELVKIFLDTLYKA
jgi:sphinganine-1-phosphate aldolase